MKKICGIGLAAIFLCSCGQNVTKTIDAPTETQMQVEVFTDTPTRTQPTVSETVVETEQTDETPTADAEIAFIYADNWGVVHNVWELSYNPDDDGDTPYLYEYRQSSTPHENVIESAPINREEGDKVFALFKERDIISAKDSAKEIEEKYRITPSSISFGYVGDDTVYHRYPPVEDFSAIMDSLQEISKALQEENPE